jgi:hypothetical protein
MLYKELSVSDAIPEARLRKAAKSGSLQLTKADLAGSGATLHVHPESYPQLSSLVIVAQSIFNNTYFC